MIKFKILKIKPVAFKSLCWHNTSHLSLHLLTRVISVLEDKPKTFTVSRRWANQIADARTPPPIEPRVSRVAAVVQSEREFRADVIKILFQLLEHWSVTASAPLHGTNSFNKPKKRKWSVCLLALLLNRLNVHFKRDWYGCLLCVDSVLLSC